MADAPPPGAPPAGIPPPPADPLIGVRVGEYHIRRVLGRGGMGVVYEAEDTALGIPVALKSISAAFARDATFVRRFRTEARAMARVASPHIVRVMALRETEEGLFIVMEYVDGGDFHDRLGDGPMPWETLWPMLRQMLLGLEAAHAVGVVHRDIKPRNVLLTRDSTVKLTDFGLARLQADGEATVTQAVAGTLSYMSPEQVRSLPTLDGRSDLFSLALTAYEALAGRLPFDRKAGEFTVMRAIVDEPFPSLTEFSPTVPPTVARALMRALEKDPDKRYATAAEMREALAAAGDDAMPTRTQVPKRRKEKEKAAPVAPVVVAPVEADSAAAVAAPARGTRWGLIAGAVVGLAALVAAGLWMMRPGRIALAPAPGVAYFIDGEPVEGELEHAAGSVDVQCQAGGLMATAAAEVARGRTRRLACSAPDLDVDVSAHWNGAAVPATVLLDGTEAGAAPLRLRLPVGRHSVRVQATRAGTLDSTVTVDVRPTFEREPPAPVAVAVRSGDRAEFTQPADSGPVTTIPGPVVSGPAPGPSLGPSRPSPGPSRPSPGPSAPTGARTGTLVASADGGMTLSVDGSGISPGSRPMAPGTYTVACSAGSLSETTRVTIRPDQPTELRCYAAERVVSVSTTAEDGTRPWMSVVVDGQTQGQTPTQITLGPGSHTVFVRRRGYTVLNDQMQTVDVGPRFSPGRLPPVTVTYQVRADSP